MGDTAWYGRVWYCVAAYVLEGMVTHPERLGVRVRVRIRVSVRAGPPPTS